MMRWRVKLRSLHRDFGYLVIGLTYIYAISGLAVNHIGDWDPNYEQQEIVYNYEITLSTDPEKAAKDILNYLNIKEAPSDIYYASSKQMEIYFENRILYVDTDMKMIVEESKAPRFFLRLANWLHLNRGKKAWTYFADTYAVVLLFLATSGFFMLPFKKVFKPRPVALILAGVFIPLLYIQLSGGP